MLHRFQRISVFFIAAAGLYAQTATPPVSTVGTTHTSGMVGVAQGQTARINVLNAASATSTPPLACVASLTYYDATGAKLKSATVSVAPGAAGHLDLFSDVDLALPVNQRKDIRATFVILAVPTPVASSTTTTPVAPACNLIGNVEIVDEITGRTEVVIGAMHEVAAPLPTTAAQ